MSPARSTSSAASFLLLYPTGINKTEKRAGVGGGLTPSSAHHSGQTAGAITFALPPQPIRQQDWEPGGRVCSDQQSRRPQSRRFALIGRKQTHGHINCMIGCQPSSGQSNKLDLPQNEKQTDRVGSLND